MGDWKRKPATAVVIFQQVNSLIAAHSVLEYGFKIYLIVHVARDKFGDIDITYVGGWARNRPQPNWMTQPEVCGAIQVF